MDPSRKIPSNIKSLSTKMLQIPWKMIGLNSKQLKWQFPAPKCSNLQGKRTPKKRGEQKNPKRFQTLCEILTLSLPRQPPWTRLGVSRSERRCQGEGFLDGSPITQHRTNPSRNSQKNNQESSRTIMNHQDKGNCDQSQYNTRWSARAGTYVLGADVRHGHVTGLCKYRLHTDGIRLPQTDAWDLKYIDQYIAIVYCTTEKSWIHRNTGLLLYNLTS